MTRARRPSTAPGPEVTIAAEQAYVAALARVNRLRTELPPGAFEARLRAGLKAARRAENSAAHRRGQEERRASTPPTRKQRQLLWRLGYRGPAPQSQAEVSALVAELNGKEG